MYWGDLAKVIRTNKSPNASFKFYPPTTIQPRICTIVDFSYPRRQNIIYTKEGHHIDELHFSIVVSNAAWLNGEVPFKTYKILDNKGNLKELRRGYEFILTTLLQEASIKPTTQIAKLLKKDHADDIKHLGYTKRWYT